MKRDEATELALQLAEQGFAVVPLAHALLDAKINKVSKRPLTYHGKVDATSDPEQIRNLFGRAHVKPDEEFGVGIMPGSMDMVVVDCDVKRHLDPPVDGFRSFVDLCKENGPLEGFGLSTTISGGKHIWLKKRDVTELIGNTNAFPEGIDICSDDRYVVAPGTTTKWGSWSLDKPLDEAGVAPEWVWDKLSQGHRAKIRDRNSNKDYLREHQPDDLMMLEYLEKLGTTHFEINYYPDGSYHSTSVWRPGKDGYLSSSASVGYAGPGRVMIFSGGFYTEDGILVPDRAEAWSIQELEAYIRKEKVRPKKSLQDHLVPAWELEDTEPPKWLIKEHLVESSIAALWSDPNIGKSFLALDWAYHIAAGKEWYGREVTQANVLYIVAEGGKQFGRRIRAWHHYHEMGTPKEAKLPLFIIGTATRLDDTNIVTEIIECAKSVDARMIVFDTLARCLGESGESENTDQNKVIMNVSEIQASTDATVLLVAHPGKANKTTIRGAYTWMGALETGFWLESKTEETFTMYNEKQKDYPKIRPYDFIREQVQYGEGEYDNSCIVRPLTQKITIGSKKERPEPKQHEKAALALYKIQLTNGADTAAWKEATKIESQPTWNRIKNHAIEQGLVICLTGDTKARSARWRVTSEFEAKIPELFGDEFRAVHD